MAQNREYVTWSGTLLGEKVSVVSTGIGCPSAAIAVEELIDVGADTLVRVGSSGSMQPDVHSGDVVVVTASIRDEGTTSHYLPLEYPAVADVDVVNALRAGAMKLGLTHHMRRLAIQGLLLRRGGAHAHADGEHLEERWNAWVAGGAMCSEMESSALFILSSIYRKRAGGVMLVINESELAEIAADDDDKHMGEFDADNVIRVAIEGFKILIDRTANANHKIQIESTMTLSTCDKRITNLPRELALFITVSFAMWCGGQPGGLNPQQFPK